MCKLLLIITFTTIMSCTSNDQNLEMDDVVKTENSAFIIFGTNYLNTSVDTTCKAAYTNKQQYKTYNFQIKNSFAPKIIRVPEGLYTLKLFCSKGRVLTWADLYISNGYAAYLGTLTTRIKDGKEIYSRFLINQLETTKILETAPIGRENVFYIPRWNYRKANMTAGLPKKVYLDTMNKNIGLINSCYDQHVFDEKPKKNEVAAIFFKIEPSGKVIFATGVRGTTKSIKLYNCLIESISLIKFPEFDSDTPMSVLLPISLFRKGKSPTLVKDIDIINI